MVKSYLNAWYVCKPEHRCFEIKSLAVSSSKERLTIKINLRLFSKQERLKKMRITSSECLHQSSTEVIEESLEMVKHC